MARARAVAWVLQVGKLCKRRICMRFRYFNSNCLRLMWAMPQVPQFLGPIHQEKQEPTARADPKKSLFNCMLSPHHQIPASSTTRPSKKDAQQQSTTGCMCVGGCIDNLPFMIFRPTYYAAALCKIMCVFVTYILHYFTGDHVEFPFHAITWITCSFASIWDYCKFLECWSFGCASHSFGILSKFIGYGLKRRRLASSNSYQFSQFFLWVQYCRIL